MLIIFFTIVVLDEGGGGGVMLLLFEKVPLGGKRPCEEALSPTLTPLFASERAFVTQPSIKPPFCREISIIKFAHRKRFILVVYQPRTADDGGSQTESGKRGNACVEP